MSFILPVSAGFPTLCLLLGPFFVAWQPGCQWGITLMIHDEILEPCSAAAVVPLSRYSLQGTGPKMSILHPGLCAYRLALSFGAQVYPLALHCRAQVYPLDLCCRTQVIPRHCPAGHRSIPWLCPVGHRPVPWHFPTGRLCRISAGFLALSQPTRTQGTPPQSPAIALA